jgi:indolepyruvate ferredoxin oxidoreductase beta subunit
MKKLLHKKVLKNTHVRQAIQKCSEARRAKTEERGVYRNTSSEEVRSTTQQMSVLQKPVKDPMNVIITGVGGQGNVLASRVLAGMLVNQGFYVTIGETFGMSQRGGSVMSHLRISQKSIMSPQIPLGRADIIIALEPVEALRVLMKYGNPNVAVLANSRVVYPIGVITGELNYPSLNEIQNILQKTTAQRWLIDATEAALALGNPVLSNVVIIGALATVNLLPIGRKSFVQEIAKNMTADKRAINLAAFDAGAAMI